MNYEVSLMKYKTIVAILIAVLVAGTAGSFLASAQEDTGASAHYTCIVDDGGKWIVIRQVEPCQSEEHAVPLNQQGQTDSGSPTLGSEAGTVCSELDAEFCQMVSPAGALLTNGGGRTDPSGGDYNFSQYTAGGKSSGCAVPGDYATIQAAVDDPGCDLISLGSGTFSENVLINRSLAIHGQGPATTIVDGGGAGHVFNILASTELDQSVAMTVTISGLSITNGDSGLYAESRNVNWDPGYGSAHLYVSVADCTISDNNGSGIRANPHDFGQTEIHISGTAINGNPGPGVNNIPGTYGTGNVELVNSTVSSNHGGGILNFGCSHDLCSATLDVASSTISGNVSSGIYSYGLANVTNSTISGNTADEGGGIYSCGTTNLLYSTVTGNSAGAGGGLFIVGSDGPYGCRGQVVASNSIVANSAKGGDCALYIDTGPWAATFADAGHNIIEDGTCIDAPTSRSGDPLLGPLADNDGPTLTHALLPGSPAIDAGDNAACPDTDQRGRPRPVDGDKVGIAICDIGSFEARPGPVLEYTDLPSFTAAPGCHLNHITFQGLPAGTIVTDQYLDVGAEFVDGNDTVLSSPHFVTDNVGIGGNGRVHVQLTKPAVAIGADFPGALTIELYDQPGGSLLYTSSNFAGAGSGFFGGVVTDMPFTYVVFRDWFDETVYLDNIHIKYACRSFMPLVLLSGGPGS